MLTDASLAQLHVKSIGDGPPLVLLHGWALHGGLFSPIVPSLARQHRVHAVDLPGHGYSDPLRPWTLQAVVESLERSFASEGALSVLGWSLGGAVALAWARRVPSRISRLVLVTTTPKFIAAADWPHAMTDDTLARFADELRVAFKPTLLRFLTLQMQGSDEGRAALATLRHQLFSRGEPDPAMLVDALASLRAIDLRNDVGHIRQPSLVVTGARDTLAPPEAGAWLAEALPAGRLHSFNGAAHAPFLSHRDAFLEVALPFLRHG
jgi:pimeloyl-[acyl-carrier protein] methyl ester esterase